MKKEDAILRLQIIDNYLKRQGDYSERDHDSIMMAIEALKEQQHGEWTMDAFAPWFRCSCCGYIYEAYERCNFCPNCGSDNRKRGEAE